MTEPLSPAALKVCREVFGGNRFLIDPADCLAYGYDNSRRVAMPQAVAFATSHDEIAALLRV
ncbi:MAG: FAD-binding oxidoreductase, partial [Pseudomonadota bacterium]